MNFSAQSLPRRQTVRFFGVSKMTVWRVAARPSGDADREFANLSSAIRLFVLQSYKDQFDRQRSEESKIAAQ
jgi:hypothetical protein